VEVLVASLVPSRDVKRTLVLKMANKLVWIEVARAHSHKTHGRTSAAANDTVPVLVLALVLLVLVADDLLEFWEEAAAIQVLRYRNIVKRVQLPVVLLASRSTNAIREGVLSSRVLLCSNVRSRVEVLLLEVEVGVISTGRSFALEVGLLHHFILLRKAQLLVGSVRRRNDDLPSAGVASLVLERRLSTVLLAAIADRLLPPQRVLLLVRTVEALLLLANLSLVSHGVSYAVNIVVGIVRFLLVLVLLLIRNLHCSILVHLREHAKLEALANQLNDVFLDVQLEHHLHDLVAVGDASEGRDGFQCQVPDLLFVVAEQLQHRVQDLIRVEVVRV